MTTSVYSLLREACGISQIEAAEHVHGTRLDTVKSWSSDRRPAPGYAVNELQSLLRRIRAAGERYAALMRATSKGNVFVLGLSEIDQDARLCGFPSMAAQRQALAIAIALLPDDAEIRIVARVRGSIPAPVLDREKLHPTATDAGVLAAMEFDGGKFYTAGKMNRRKYERLEDIGWVKGLGVREEDVEYRLTGHGRLQLGLARAAADARGDMPDPAPGGFQTMVNAGPRRKAHLKLLPRQTVDIAGTKVRVEKIDGQLVAVALDSGEGGIELYADPVLL